MARSGYMAHAVSNAAFSLGPRGNAPGFRALRVARHPNQPERRHFACAGGREHVALRQGGSATDRTRIRAGASGPATAWSAALANTVGAGSVRNFRWISRDGSSASAVVVAEDQYFSVEICYIPDRSIPQGHIAVLQWGMHRASPSKWHHPEGVAPPGSVVHAETGAMRTPMEGAEDGVWRRSFRVPRNTAPAFLAAVPTIVPSGDLQAPGVPMGVHGSDTCCVPLGCASGVPSPLGASIAGAERDAAGNTSALRYRVNFSVVSRHATQVSLCLQRFDPAQGPQGKGFLEVALDPAVNKTGDVWHICLDGLRNLHTLYYGFRVQGNLTWEHGHRFDPTRVLLDPYATLVRALPRTALPADAGPVDASPVVHMGSLLGAKAAPSLVPFDWEGIPRPSMTRSFEELVVCEIDLRVWAGSYAGLVDRIQEIAGMGFNGIVLTGPSTLSIGGKALSLFSPDPALTSGGAVEGAVFDGDHPATAATELKYLVREMHRAGIEVLLEINPSTVADASDDTSTGAISLRGIDSALYFRDGTTLDCSHPIVQDLIVASLQHLYEEYELDGFVFDRAENLTLDPHGASVMGAPLVEAIAYDYRLGRMARLVASPKDASKLPRNGIRGFPHWGRWSEANEGLASEWWAYLGDGTNPHGVMPAIAHNLAGALRLFGPSWTEDMPGSLAAGRRPSFYWNRSLPSFVASPAALCAAGPEASTRVRTAIAASMVAPGVPFVPIGVDAELPDSLVDVPKLLRVLAKFRARNLAILQPEDPATRRVTWHGVDPNVEPTWESQAGGHPAYLGMMATNGQGAVFIAFNPHPAPVAATLPGAPGGTAWNLVAATAPSGGVAPPPGGVVVGGLGLVALEAVPVGA